MSDISARIVDGDNKLEMFQQLLDIGRHRNVSPLFRLELAPAKLIGSLVKPVKAYVRISGIKAESGDGESWIITGQLVRTIQSVPTWYSTAIGEDVLFEGYYNTRRREGSIKMI